MAYFFTDHQQHVDHQQPPVGDRWFIEYFPTIYRQKKQKQGRKLYKHRKEVIKYKTAQKVKNTGLIRWKKNHPIS